MQIKQNKNTLNTLSQMLRKAQFPHALLFYGTHGLGKKTLADYTARMLLCLSNSANPCGECKNCKNIAAKIHPDVIYPEHSGKLGGFSVETVRNIIADAYISPNDGKYKIYIWDDADAIQPAAQNALLKIIEEPPPNVVFIFTAASPDVFLDTIKSRVIMFGMEECTKDDINEVLAEYEGSQNLLNDAYELYGGNIGKCKDYLTNEKTHGIAELASGVLKAFQRNNEYDALVLFSKIGERGEANEMLSLCGSLLTKYFSPDTAVLMHDAIINALTQISSNVSVKFTLSVLCSELAGITS